MRRTAFFLFIALTLAGCSNPRNERIRCAVESHLELYPEARLQDLYKAFFQAEFGAEHIVADTGSAGKYLDSELKTRDNSKVLYEPIGADSTYYRVHLRAVQEGYISRDQLFHAFLGGVQTVEIPQVEKWAETWPKILKVIDGMNLALPDYDRERVQIDSLLAAGSYALHHSRAFSAAYDPHYRIIRRDIFEKELLPFFSLEKKSFSPGDTVPEAFLKNYKEYFKVSPVPDDIFALMQGKTYKEDCTVPREDLRYILCLHKDIEGRSIVGEMVASKEIAGKLKDIFLQLYEASYPIGKMRLPDYWDADDEKMMRENNSSCFNFRTLPNSSKPSKHGLGLAVDINPLFNPYCKLAPDGTLLISPETAAPFMDRDANFSYKIVRGDLCHRLFLENGFKWGGGWATMKDYQHFEY